LVRDAVVRVHGDSHYFLVDKPLLDPQGRRVENFTSVETFGDHADISPAQTRLGDERRSLGQSARRPEQP
jgi:hypothetical protein